MLMINSNEEGGFQADVFLHSKSNPDMITVYP